jgi:uncharacterized caspase-like protein
MKFLRAIAVAIIFAQGASAFASSPVQDADSRDRYEQAMALAASKNFDRAYELIVKVVNSDLLYYEACVLRIALATITKKAGPESPQNLMRVAKGRFPMRVNIEQDIQGIINTLGGGAVAKVRESAAEVSKAEVSKAREPVKVSPYVQKKLALVVGVGSFKDTSINQLRFTANDARTFADTLRKECRFDTVKTLVDEQATTVDVKDAIDNLAKEATPEDLVVIYIASHGSPEDSDKAGVSYIVTYDTKVDKLYATAFKMEDLLGDIEKRFSAERVIVFIDTCYSGATFKAPPKEWATGGRGLRVISSGLRASSIENRIRQADRGVEVAPATSREGRKRQGIGRVIIASSRENEQSWESEQIQHGYFTYYLIEALKRQSSISVQGLFDYLSAEVPRAVERDKKATQNPVMIKSLRDPVEIYLRDDQASGQRTQKQKP